MNRGTQRNYWMTKESPDPLIGTTFGHRYYIERLLGTGGMGSVYLAGDTQNNDEAVAVKILHAALSRDEKHVKRFLREVQLTRKISHSNVVRVFDVGQQKGQLFFTMEYVEGISLKGKLREARLKIDDILRILQEICRGLEAIHQGGIIHQDLKPANILLDSDESAKIADFGVARPLQTSRVGSEVVGSAGYMSPELWRSEEIDATADIYSLGVMLYEMVTGLRPFDGESSAEVMNHHLYTSPRAPVSDIIEIPTWLTALILMMLEKEPLKRPQSAGEVLSIIQSATHGSAQKSSAGSDGKRSNQAVERNGNAETVVLGGKVKPGLLERDPVTATKNRMTVSARSGSDKGKKDFRHSDLVPEIPNPAISLSIGVLSATIICFILGGPSRVLFDKFAASNSPDTLSLTGMATIYLVLAIAAGGLLSVPVLVLSAGSSSFQSQAFSFIKAALYTSGFILFLSAVHMGDFLISTGIKINTIGPVQISDIGNAAIANMFEGALLMPLPTGFESRLMFPAARMQPRSGLDTVLAFKFILGVILYVTGIILCIKKQRSAHPEISSRVNLYSCYGIGLAFLIAGILLRSTIIPKLPFDATALYFFNAGFFTLKAEMYSIIWAGITWMAVICVFLATLGRAYNAALADRLKRLRKLHQGMDPSRDIIGRR